MADERPEARAARRFFTAGAVLGLLGVGLGAFAAHGLRAVLAPERLVTFETGVRYQLLHALALLGVAWASERWPGRLPRAAGWTMLAGVVIFSGSLYLLCLTGVRGLGAITPVGGVLMLAGWLLLALSPWVGRAR